MTITLSTVVTPIQERIKNAFKIEDGVDFHWQWYKSFFSLNYIRYFGTWFATAPIIASFFGINKSNYPICIGEDCVNIAMNLPFSWWILWIGSVSFISAFTIYHFYCPTFIKRYSSYADYVNAYHAPRWAAWEALYLVQDAKKSPDSYDLDKFVDRTKEKKYLLPTSKSISKPHVVVEENSSVLYFEHDGLKYKLAMPPKKEDDDNCRRINERAVYEVVWEIFGRRASSYRRARFAITWLIRFSFACVAYTILENIYSAATMIS